MNSIEISGRRIPVKIRRNNRARRILLRFNIAEEEVRLTIPPGTSFKSGLAFLHQSTDWLRNQVRDISEKPSIFGNPLTILDKTMMIGRDETRPRRIFLEAGNLIVGGPADHAEARLKNWLRQEARTFFLGRSDCYAERLGADYGRITIRDTISRWGSCSARGNLSFCWRLVLAPSAVADYVAAHEVCHLREMNHSPAFWRLVAGLCPDYKKHRAWLRQKGSRLHQY